MVIEKAKSLLFGEDTDEWIALPQALPFIVILRHYLQHVLDGDSGKDLLPFTERDGPRAKFLPPSTQILPGDAHERRVTADLGGDCPAHFQIHRIHPLMTVRPGWFGTRRLLHSLIVGGNVPALKLLDMRIASERIR